MNDFSEEFRGFVSKEPVEPWGYDVDDHGITYGPGWWPWYRHYEWSRLAPAGIRPASLRLSPDDTYEAGDQRYVLTWPNDNGCELDLSWMTRRQGLGGMVRKGFVRLDRDLRIVSSVPADAREIIEARVEKFHTLYRRAIAERDAGQKAPVTMHEKWVTKQEKK